MKAVGLVTEYNPLHNGHIYHIRKSVEITNADVCIAVMSGNFVQRGEPAIIDKYSRCQAAVASGINLLVELPSYYALSSAEMFADGAVKTLAALGTGSMVFGSECGDISLLKDIAKLLILEPENYKELLKKNLRKGQTFPKARQNALEQVMQQSFDTLLSSPNNILGIEYIKAILKRNAKITPHTLLRQGAGYHELQPNTNEEFSSAAAVRELICQQTNKGNAVSDCEVFDTAIPNDMKTILQNQLQVSAPIVLNDFTPLLNYKLSEICSECYQDKNLIAKRLSGYVDIPLELGNRIAACFTGMDTFSELIVKIKSRQYTYSRIARCLMHILLNIQKTDTLRYEAAQAPYIRILGFDEKGQQYLSSIKKNCPVPIITKTADYKELLRNDIYCASVYNQVVFQKYGYRLKDEFRQGIYIRKS